MSCGIAGQKNSDGAHSGWVHSSSPAAPSSWSFNMVVQGTTALAGCCKAFYDLPLETPGHYFCHILLVNQVTQDSTY